MALDIAKVSRDRQIRGFGIDRNSDTDTDLRSSVWAERARRVLDVLVSLAVFVIFSPVFLAIGLCIWLSSPGPIFFVQNRIGYRGKNFRFVKFRTLYADARERWPELYRYQYSADQLSQVPLKFEPDPRIIPCGRLLRGSSLDELPNFWNVLTGEMTLVGPRPDIEEMRPYYSDQELHLKYSVKPGVTGLAQVSGRAHLTFTETRAYDLAYVRNRSWRVDSHLVLKTIISVLRRHGAH